MATPESTSQAASPIINAQPAKAGFKAMRIPEHLQSIVKATPALFAHVSRIIGQSREMRAQLGYTTEAVYSPTTNEVLQAVLKSAWLQSLIRTWLAENKRNQSSALGSRPEAGASALATARQAQPPLGAQVAASSSVSSGPVIDLEPNQRSEAVRRAPFASQTLGLAGGLTPTAVRQAGPAEQTAAVRMTAPTAQPWPQPIDAARASRTTTAQPVRPITTFGSALAATADRQPASVAVHPDKPLQPATSADKLHQEAEADKRPLFRQRQEYASPYLSGQPSALRATGQASQNQALPITSASPLSARRDPRLQQQSPRSATPRGPAQAFPAPPRHSESQPAQSLGRQVSDPVRQSDPPRQGSLPSQGSLPRQNPQGSGGMAKSGVTTRPGLLGLPEAVGEKESAWRVS